MPAILGETQGPTRVLVYTRKGAAENRGRFTDPRVARAWARAQVAALGPTAVVRIERMVRPGRRRS